MKALYYGVVVMSLIAGSALGVNACPAESSDCTAIKCNRTTQLQCPGVDNCCQQKVCDRIRTRAEMFARKWPLEIKQQWIRLITPRAGILYPSIDVTERLFSTFRPDSQGRRQQLQLLDEQLTLVFADLLMDPCALAMMENLSYKNLLPNDPHRQRARQFRYESQRLQALLAQARAVAAEPSQTLKKEQVDDSGKEPKGAAQLDEAPRLIAITINNQGDYSCYISPVEELLKPGDPFQGGHIQTISSEGVVFVKAGQSHSLNLSQ